MEKQRRKRKENTVLAGILAAEAFLVLTILFFLSVPILSQVYAVVGANNVTVTTLLQVGNVFPEVVYVSVNNGSAITLAPNATVNVTIYAVVRDFNTDGDIFNVSVVFYNNRTSTYGSADDLNRHYVNSSCFIDTTYGTIYEANATCLIQLQYFAEAGSWNATITAYDNASFSGQNSSMGTVNSLLAIGLPDTIDYGIVNATAVSSEKIANITNFGNVPFNVSLRGYAVSMWDNLSMNCTLGTIKNISINYEKYNMTNSISGDLTLPQFEGNYTNLTSASLVTRKMNIPYREYDGEPYTDDTNSTYWRMYVPLGVAGSCQGKIVFGAVQSTGLG
jgi:hypothetical protein